ncbi:MAG: NAD(P)-dependent oxidoreductase [archaeon]
MPGPKIFVFSSVPKTEGDFPRLSALGKVSVVIGQKLSEEATIELGKEAEIIVAGPSTIPKFSERLFSSLPSLKLVCTMTVGVGWLDLGAAKRRGVVVSNAKGANTESVAEHIWEMILDLSKRASEFWWDARTKGACRFQEYKGREVYGKTIGIIGLGNIGTKVARIAGGFDMRVIGLNKSGRPVPGVELVTFEKLLKESDVIVLAVPTLEETLGLIGEREISEMKDGVIVVNCANEDIVNKDAIVAAVRSGKVFGYGVETDLMQPIPKEDPYFTTPRIFACPANAFNTSDSDRKILDVTAENISGFLSGEPKNRVA